MRSSSARLRCRSIVNGPNQSRASSGKISHVFFPYWRPSLFFIIFLVPLFPLFNSAQVSARTLYGEVLKVFDGDTILVRVQGQEEHVRLREIDAPEITHRKKAGQEPWGRKARDFAKSLVEKKKVRMELEERDERDKYHRILAYVFLNHTFVNREMISSGNAFFYPGIYRGKRAAQLQAAEEVARSKGLGIWDKKKGLKERPQDFRARTQRDESLFSKFWRLIRGEDKKPSPKEYPVPANKIVANKRSMVYYMPGSPGAARVSPKNRILFDTPEEAEKAGFRQGKSGNS